MSRYYYKPKDGNGILNLKEQLNDENYIEITEEEYNELTTPKELTPEQKERREKRSRINELKKLLRESDYKAIKYAEGFISESEYAPIKALRQSYREEINRLEAELGV